MTREDAIRRVCKLDALGDPARGGTEAECRLARDKAAMLRAKFGLGQHETRRPHQRRRRPFTAPRRGPAVLFNFDIATGQAGPGVRVQHYKDRANWKVEIDLG